MGTESTELNENNPKKKRATVYDCGLLFCFLCF